MLALLARECENPDESLGFENREGSAYSGKGVPAALQAIPLDLRSPTPMAL
jgi:hypothetical protein